LETTGDHGFWQHAIRYEQKAKTLPRRARLSLPHVPLHIIQRGNNRQACFFADEDYRFYLDWLSKHADKTGCRVHAYVLMTNHVHLLISTERAEAPGALMKGLGQRYVQYVTALPPQRHVVGRALSLLSGPIFGCHQGAY
jgi:REP element-mobilizing transposase RayT